MSESQADPRLPEYQIIPPLVPHTASIIFVHGLGHSSLSWKTLVEQSLASNLPHIRWIFPQAPEEPVTYSQGKLRPSWFDIHQLPPTAEEFDEHSDLLSKSMSSLKNLVLREIQRGIDPKRIVLIGFSQGAALSLMTALSSLQELGGIVSLSGWIPLRFQKSLKETRLESIPILWCHGDADDEIPLEMGLDAIRYLALPSIGSLAEIKTYENLKHTTNAEEFDDLRKWLVKILPVTI